MTFEPAEPVVTDRTDDFPSRKWPLGGARRPQAGRNFSKLPALVVLGVAVAVIALFGALSALTGPSPRSHRPSNGSRHVSGSSLLGVPAAKMLKPIEHPGTPPSNILDALMLPAGSVSHGYTDNSGDFTQYDEQMRFSLDTSEGAIVTFFHAVLRDEGWGIADVGPAHGVAGGVEILGQKAGTDGWYWEAGVVVSPTTFDSSAGSPSSSAGSDAGRESTSYSVKLLQVLETE